MDDNDNDNRDWDRSSTSIRGTVGKVDGIIILYIGCLFSVSGPVLQ